MGVQQKITLPVGSRCLTYKECKSVLPTYDELIGQIDAFHLGDKPANLNNGDRNMQKTNNIGIMGKRGTGKSSLLKTIRYDLEKGSNGSNGFKEKYSNDILLPIIVPENMPESNTLFSTIIGLLSTYVNKAQKMIKSKWVDISSSNCMDDGSYKVVSAYENVVRQYCLIKPDYRQILINQYTSLTDYVESSKNTFNSDQKFIEAFDNLVNILLDTLCKNENGRSAMLVIFIDDVDLSTDRCLDIIKTLLSYVSHPRVITLISGDLDTFEESIATELIRGDVELLDKEFAEGKTLLKRRKELAFEYLKKVVPPAYRHNVKTWKIAERGNYFISRDPEEESPQKLSDLLRERLQGLVEDTFFVMKVGEGVQPLPLAHHLFDETSRGLNNIYSVLHSMTFNEKDRHEGCVKLFEVIVASNPLFNANRDLINSVISIGTSMQSTTFRFDNFIQIITASADESARDNTSNNKQQPVMTPKKSFDLFKLFTLLEFARQLFGCADVQNELSYTRAKNQIITILIGFPIIHGSSELLRDFDLSITKENEVYSKKYSDIPANKMLGTFLSRGSFILALHVYEACVQHGYDVWARDCSLDVSFRISSSIYKGLCSYAGKSGISRTLAENYEKFERPLTDVLAAIPGDFAHRLAGLIFEPIAQELIKFINSNETLNIDGIRGEAEEKINGKFKIISFSGGFVNFELRKAMTSTIFAQECSGLITENATVNEITELDPNDEIGVQEREMHEQARLIDKNRLWDNPTLELARENIFNNVLEKYKKALKKTEHDGSEFKLSLSGTVIKAAKCIFTGDKGTTYTHARALSSYLLRMLKDSERGNEFRGSIQIKTYVEIIAVCKSYLATTAWYMKPEVSKLVDALGRMTFELDEAPLGKHKYHAHYYARYRERAILNAEQIEMLKSLDSFKDQIYGAWNTYRTKTDNEISQMLNITGGKLIELDKLFKEDEGKAQ